MPADEQRDALERALGAQYEIVRLLGRGGMGAVYLARERALERAVAIKVLPPGLAQDHESRERFRREARTAANLTHPNIVPLYTFGEVDGMLYFVMGYVRGESLGQRLHRERQLPPDSARRIIGELADALHYAHRQGVIHRDIKPDNVLLDDETGRPMLTDFGVAKATASGTTLTEVGAIVGTPHYMSPEQASGERALDGRSDLYSLGVMGYLMLSGRLPFEGDSLRSVIAQHVTQEAPPLTVLVPGVPSTLAAAVHRCLAKAPADRWAHGASLRSAIGSDSDDDDDALTQPFFAQNLEGIGTKCVTMLAATGLFGFASYLFPILNLTRAGPWWIPPLLIGAAIALIPAAFAVVERIHSGRSWREILRGVFRAPRWWPYWYPTSLRRPGDVWDRLTPESRRARAWHLAGMAFMSLAIPVGLAMWSQIINHPIAPMPLWIWVTFAAAYGGFFGFAIPAVVIARRWARAHGIPVMNAQKVFFAPTAVAELWRKPKYAELLLPAAPAAARNVEPATPSDYVKAIAAGVKGLPEPAQGLGIDVVAASRQVVAVLDTLGKEVTQLSRDASPADLAQVEQKLAALGDPAGDHEARGRMRGLLNSQCELLRGLADKLTDAERRRAHLLDLLRTLWLQVANLRAEVARDAMGASEVTGKVRALCDEIEQHAKAVVTVRDLQ